MYRDGLIANRTYMWMTALLTGLAVSNCIAQEAADGKTAEADFVMAELKVVLTGSDGEAVVGALVMPYAMEMVEIDGHGFWDDQKFGVPKDYVSDAQGVATIRYPASEGMGQRGKLTTKLVTFQIEHTDYVQQVVHCELGPDLEHPIASTDVQLKKGCEVELAAINSKAEKITEFGILMAGRSAADLWATTEDGGKRTSAVNDGTWQTMLVAPQKDGPTLFSGLLPLRVRPSQAVRLRNVLLTPGTVVHGQLSDVVPRPVRNGQVITTTAPKPAGDSYAEQDPSLVWIESAAINEDGTFTLPSIPRSGKIQVIAVCDDFVCKTTMPDARSFVMGQLFDVVDGAMTVTIDMEATASVELTIRRPDGSLLESGIVSATPNQKFYLGGSTFLGESFSSLDSIQRQMLPADERPAESWYKRRREFPFMEQPVIDGVVTLRGLPARSNHAQRAGLYHKEFAFPTMLGEGYGMVRYPLKPGEVTKMEVTVVPDEQAAKKRKEQSAEVQALQAVGGLLKKAMDAVQGK